VQGPVDVIGDAEIGVLGDDLRAAALAALRIDRTQCRDFALCNAWAVVTRDFIARQRPVRFGKAVAVTA
jgi:hypothetical protein